MIYVFGDTIIDKEIMINSLTENGEEENSLKANIKFTHTTPGGAANVAMNVRSLSDVPVCFYTAPNDTRDYSVVKNTLNRNGVFVKEIGNHALPVIKHRMRVPFPYKGKPITRFDLDAYADNSLNDSEYGLANDMINDRFLDADIFVIADYHKGFFGKTYPSDSDARFDIVHNAIKVKKLVVVDPGKFSKVKDWNSWLNYGSSNYSVFKFNQHQAISYLTANEEKPCDYARFSPEAIYASVCHYSKNGLYKFFYKHLVITFGAAGYVTMLDNKIVHRNVPFMAPYPVDVCGAGDTFLAGLAVGLKEGRDIVQSCEFAQIAAGVAVRTRGTATVTRKDVLKCESSETVMTL